MLARRVPLESARRHRLRRSNATPTAGGSASTRVAATHRATSARSLSSGGRVILIVVVFVVFVLEVSPAGLTRGKGVNG